MMESGSLNSQSLMLSEGDKSAWRTDERVCTWKCLLDRHSKATGCMYWAHHDALTPYLRRIKLNQHKDLMPLRTIQLLQD
ncbi:hypothetical protein NC652_024393 [Populus alba x Populus x berolinensis]|nr:hypothetical protein NC652_024393 [Populus alba x Populus x berolinensis]